MSQREDELGFILRSETRVHVLSMLSKKTAAGRSTLIDCSETSRRTVNRVLTDLESRGYLSQSSGTFRLTAYGDVMADIVSQWTERRDFLEEFRPFLTETYSADLGFDPLLLRTGDETTATETEPFAPLERLLSLRKRSTEIRIISPLIERAGLEQIRERLDGEEDVSLEAIIPESMYRQVLDGSRYSDLFADVVEADSTAVFVYPETLPAFFGLFDEIATVAVTDGGIPSAMVESSNEQIVQAIRKQFEQYQTESSRIDSLSGISN